MVYDQRSMYSRQSNRNDQLLFPRTSFAKASGERSKKTIDTNSELCPHSPYCKVLSSLQLGLRVGISIKCSIAQHSTDVTSTD